MNFATYNGWWGLDAHNYFWRSRSNILILITLVWKPFKIGTVFLNNSKRSKMLWRITLTLIMYRHKECGSGTRRTGGAYREVRRTYQIFRGCLPWPYPQKTPSSRIYLSSRYCTNNAWIRSLRAFFTYKKDFDWWLQPGIQSVISDFHLQWGYYVGILWL